MNEGDEIQEMFDRFNDILNGLKALGKTYFNPELVRKILRILTKSWASKKDAILEAKDLNNVSLEDYLDHFLLMRWDCMKMKSKDLKIIREEKWL